MIYYFRNALMAISAIIMLTLFYMLASCEFVHAKPIPLSRMKQARKVIDLPRKTVKLAKELRFDTPRVEINE